MQMALNTSSFSPNEACINGKSANSRSLSFLINNRHLVMQSSLSYSTSFRQFGLLTCKASNTSDFRWAKDATTPKMTPGHILPDDKKPKLSEVSHCCIPLIDMEPNDKVIEKVAKACEEYGFFQIINHKIPHELCQRMLNAVTDLFHLPPEEKALLFSDDPAKDAGICHHYRKTQTSQEKVALWSEVFKHSWHPVDDFTGTLPVNKTCSNC